MQELAVCLKIRRVKERESELSLKKLHVLQKQYNLKGG